jgi:hypothetical protein
MDDESDDRGRVALAAATRAANDNGWSFGRPVVRAARRRSDATYARSDNVLLPLRFAERMFGWRSRLEKSSS